MVGKGWCWRTCQSAEGPVWRCSCKTVVVQQLPEKPGQKRAIVFCMIKTTKDYDTAIKNIFKRNVPSSGKN